jgi:hypothetical protein
VRYNAAIVAASALESPGTLQCLGKNSTVSPICSCPGGTIHSMGAVVLHRWSDIPAVEAVR